MVVTDLDERRHPVEHPDAHWSDSLYFNGFDLASDTCFLTRMAVLPNQPAANALFVAWRDGAPAYGYYRELDHLPGADWDATTIAGLGYRMLESRRRWSLELDDGDNKAYLEFEGTGGCFDYADNAAPLPRPVAWGHYEQSGTVRGDLVLGGCRLEFDGVSQRDHSWGWRDWSGVREWHWVTGLFPPSGSRSLRSPLPRNSGGPGAGEPGPLGEGWQLHGVGMAFNLFHVVDGAGRVSANGYVLDNGQVHPIVRADRQTREGPGRVPEGYDLTLEVAGGASYEVAAERSHESLPLQPGSTTVQEAPMRLRSGRRAGLGIYELLFNDHSGQEMMRDTTRSD